MIVIQFASKSPQFSPSCFIAENATLVGDVRLRENVSIWFGAVLRADINYIEIGKSSNIQDNAVFHVDYSFPVILGEGVTIGHNAIIHACRIADYVLIGMGAILLDNVEVGSESIIAAGSVVRPNTKIPSRVLVAGVPATIKREVTTEEIEMIRKSAKEYAILKNLYIPNPINKTV